MYIKRAHCMFEQSGTFKNEFIKLGIPAVDYDIQNNFGETDHVIDLFNEINKAYENENSVFDSIDKDDLIIAFFPCTYFETMQMLYYTGDSKNITKTGKEKFDIIIDRINNREKFLILLYKLVAIAEIRNLKLIIENPATEPNYLLFPQVFYRKPTFIDRNRMLRGDFMKKPTAYWFFNIEIKHGYSYATSKERKKVMSCKKSTKPGICSDERSMISPLYARNFICDFILGKENENTIKTLF